jgi:hypothetical protein
MGAWLGGSFQEINTSNDNDDGSNPSITSCELEKFLILSDYYFCFDFFGIFFAVASVGWQD